MKGYVPADIRVFAIRDVILEQETAEVCESPDIGSKISEIYREGHKFTLTNIVESNGMKWCEVRDAHGKKGFINAETKVAPAPQRQRGTHIFSMLLGATMFVGGIVILSVASGPYGAPGVRMLGLFFLVMGALGLFAALLLLLKS